MASRLATWTPPRLSPWQRFRRDPATSIARWLHLHRPSLAPCAPAADPITVVCISDTHNTKLHVPDGDLLLHAGDLTDHGTFEELQAQLDWLASLPHRHIVVIAGNHDRILDAEFVRQSLSVDYERPGASHADLNWHHITYLNNSSRTLKFANDRELTVFGSPWTPLCGNFAFQYPPIRDVWTGTIPDGTDVLLTHGAPKGYMDLEGKGCPHLTREITRMRPRLVVFGHIHEGHGRQEVEYRTIETLYQKVMGEDGGLLSAIAMAFWLLASWMWALFCSILGHQDSVSKTRTTMVNAAIVCGPKNEGHRPAAIIEV